MTRDSETNRQEDRQGKKTFKHKTRKKSYERRKLQVKRRPLRVKKKQAALERIVKSDVQSDNDASNLLGEI